ncbi:MAG: general L-amino acid transport system substrate-binding protein [Parasphingorhabdus sp.]|jgi:general L-amino acid transport system substrate-binding protein
MSFSLKNTLAATASAGFIALSALSLPAYAGNGDTLKAVKERGSLLCSGHNGSFPPFTMVTDDNKWSGYDIDYCRALSIAIFGSDESLKVVPVSWAQRFPSLQSGDLDIIIKATGWTMGRDTELGIQFSVPYFVGATQVMMPKSLGSTEPETLRGGSLCANAGTSTERLAANFFKSRNIEVEMITFEKSEETRAAYFAGRCDSLVGWGPNLAVTRNSADNPDDHVMMNVALALEPESAAMRQGDDNWVDIVNWMFAATWHAESKGVTAANVDDMKANPPDDTVAKLLGASPGIGERLGLSDDWAYNVIKQLGNSAEIFDRNIGAGSPYNLERGLNGLWSNGGVIVPMILD